MAVLTSKKALQLTICVAVFVPLLAGGAGIFFGPAMLDIPSSGAEGADLESHYRYLSGLLFAIGLGFLACVPQIEARTQPIRLLTFIVFVGGVARLLALGFAPLPSLPHLAALVMELAVTPLLCLWQSRVARENSL
jgi:Domain of unknown function (DUF4345)